MLPGIEEDLHVSHGVAGLLGTIPVLCMGVFAPAAVLLLRRLGLRHAVVAATAAIGVGGLLRASVPGMPGVLLFTIPVGIGIGLSGTLLPIAVKERLGHRAGFATGVYSSGIVLGSGIGALIAVPLADLGGRWQTPFIVISAVTLVLLPVWLLLSHDLRGVGTVRTHSARLPLRSRTGWWLVGVFALQGMTFYGLNAWLADSYVERGWSESAAGVLVTVLNLTSLPGTLLVVWFADRFHSLRGLFVACGSVMTLGAVGIVVAPGWAYSWATLDGVAGGAIFALLLILPLDAARRPDEVGAYAGMMLGGGYALTAIAPFALGAVRDASGSFTLSLWLIVGTAATVTAACAFAYPRRLRRHSAEHALPVV
jgi:CP family cyanate transporter-like MFS transporter